MGHCSVLACLLEKEAYRYLSSRNRQVASARNGDYRRRFLRVLLWSKVRGDSGEMWSRGSDNHSGIRYFWSTRTKNASWYAS